MKKILHRIKLRTWIALILIGILLPIALFRVIYQISAALPTITAYWKFDESQGSTANDASNNSNSGTITNATWQAEGLCAFGPCLFYDGTDDQVSRADDADFDFTGAESFTFSTWFRHAPKSSGTDVILAKIEATGTDGGYRIQMESDGDITCEIEDDDANTVIDDTISSTAATYDDNQWHYVACVKSTTASLTLYIDGVQVAQDASLDGSSTLANDETFYFGSDDTGSTNEFTGFLDELKMYRTALTQAQINTDMNRGAAERFEPVASDFLTKGLTGYWKLDEGTGTTTTADSSGNSNTVTIGSSAAGADTNDPAWAVGKYNTGLDFDGSDNYISTSSTIAFNTKVISVGFWLNWDAYANDDDLAMELSSNFTNTDGTFIINPNSSAGGGNQFEVAIQDSVGGSALYRAEIFTRPSAAAFHYYTFVFDNSTTAGDIKVFVDGVEQSTTISTNTKDQNSNFATDTLYFMTRGGSLLFGAGVMDDVRIYNRGLSGAEAKGLYSAAPGPAGHWRMDENTGTSATDSSGNANTLTLTNTPTWVAGKYGAAINFAASDQQLTRADDADFDFIDDADMTFSTFFKHDTASAQQIIMSKYQEAGYKMIMESDGDITCALDYDSTWTPTDSATSTAATYDDNQWHHASCVKVGATSLSLYIDGQLVASDTSLTATNTLTNSDPLYVAIDADGASNDFVGQIDEAKIYNYARTSSQVIEDMNAGHPVGGSPISSQLVWWKFDEGNATTANNSGSASSSNGTLTTMDTAPSTATSGWTFNGKVNKALIFDGSNDKVVLGQASDAAVDFNGAEAFTMSAWIYSTSVPVTTTDEDLIVGKWDETNSLRTYRIFLENDDTDSTGNIRVEIYDESADQTISVTGANDAILENTWYHVAFTFNGGTAGAANDLNLFVNGYHIGGNSANTSFLGLEDLASDFTVGDYDADDSDTDLDGFTGRIDEVKVYPGALSVANIQIDMNGGAAANYGYVQSSSDESSQLSDGTGVAPVGYWPMDENTGTTSTFDKSGNENTGTLNNVDSGDWTPAKNGSGLRLNGTDETVTAADSTSLDVTAGVSAMGWVNVTTAGINQQDTITYDTAASTSAANTNQATFSITVASNSNRMLVLGATAEDTEETEVPVSSADFNGDAMTLAIARNQAATTDRNAELWYLVAPDTGTHTVTVNFAGTVTSIAVGAVSLYNVSQAAPEATGSGGSANNTATTINITTLTANAWVVDAVINGATGDFTAGTDQVERWDVTAGGHQGASSTKPIATAGATTMTQTNTGSSGMSHVAAAFAPSSTVADATVIGKGSDAYNLTLSSALTLTATINTSNTTTATLTTGMHHVAMTYDAANLKIYIDGVQQNTAAVTGTVNTNATSLTIGQYINGIIDDFKVYGYGRTQAQVAYDYNRGRPAGWWKMDDNVSGNAQTINDSSGKGLSGTTSDGANDTGMDCTVSGKLNLACDFDATDDLITVTNNIALDFDTGLNQGTTISAWIFVDSDGEGDNGHVVAKSDTTFIKVSGESGGRVTVDGSLDLSTDATASVSSAIPISEWHHVALTWTNDADDEITLWIDGQSRATSTDGVGGPSTDTSAVTIGNRAGTDRTFDGKVDDLRIYPYELSATQIRKVMNNDAEARFGPSTGTP